MIRIRAYLSLWLSLSWPTTNSDFRDPGSGLVRVGLVKLSWVELNCPKFGIREGWERPTKGVPIGAILWRWGWRVNSVSEAFVGIGKSIQVESTEATRQVSQTFWLSGCPVTVECLQVGFTCSANCFAWLSHKPLTWLETGLGSIWQINIDCNDKASRQTSEADGTKRRDQAKFCFRSVRQLYHNICIYHTQTYTG